MKLRPYALILAISVGFSVPPAFASGGDALKCLLKVTKLSPAKSEEANLAAIAEINSTPPPLAKSNRVISVKRASATEVYDMINEHPVVQMGVKKYDPKENLGFCFGRATAAHLELLARGVHQGSIRKVWVAGTMQTDDNTWAYHVATMVRASADSKAGWWVIDPVADEVLSLRDWYTYMKTFDSEGDLRLYVTNAKRFSPSTQLPYTQGAFSDPYYNGYFEDFLTSLQVGRTEHGGLSGPSLIPGGPTPSDPTPYESDAEEPVPGRPEPGIGLDCTV